jgi:UDP-galactose transporter B1
MFSFGLMLSYLLLSPFTNELGKALMFCEAHPQVIKDILLFGLMGSIGQCFIFFTLENFGSLVLVTVTVTRKMFSILLSVFWFGHSLSFGQWSSVFLVFFAIAWEAFGNNKHAPNVENVKIKETKPSRSKRNLKMK